MTPAEIPYGNIITGIATVVAVVIANRLSYGRTNREKLWDLRRQSYGFILSELGSIEQICDIADEYISEGGEQRYFEGQDQLHNEKIHMHMNAMRKRFADDYLILSDTFIALYEKLSKEMSSDPYNSTPSDDHDIFSAAIRKYRPLLTTLARSEMMIHNRWWQPSR
jgi:hypothetical protein